MRLFLEPAEPLLFRTGLPFDAGENSYAETLFPPTPETLQGAIRAAIATYWNQSKSLEELFLDQELTKRIGNGTHDYGSFRITGQALGRRKKNEDGTEDGTIERLFPAPSHLVIVEDPQGNRQQVRLKPQKMEELKKSDLFGEPDKQHYLLPERDVKGKRKPIEGWLTEQGLEKALRTHELLTKDEIVSMKDIYRRESRLGIALDSTTKTTKEGFLYQTQVIRMLPGYGFVIDIRLCNPSISVDTPYFESFMNDDQTQRELRLPDENEGWIILGGERRTARFKILQSSPQVQEKEIERIKRGNLLYLATPAALDDGWQAKKQWAAPLTSPITAAINRYQMIGGWALNPGDSGGRNKTMRRCVPAGSVYFFDQEVSVTQPLTNYGLEIGYGIIYAGEW
jgi:CRISPR-associated protein Cmr3